MDNYKVSLIFDGQVENTRNGQIVKSGDSKGEELHIETLLDLSKKYFSTHSVLSQLNYKHRPETVAYFMTKMGTVVFLNTTRYTEACLKKYGKSGMFLLPDTITEKQFDAIKILAGDIVDFNITYITDLKLEDGMVQGKNTMGSKITDNEMVINDILNKVNIIKEDNKTR